MTSDVIIKTVQHGRDWVDYFTLLFALLGVAVLALYTHYTKKLVELTSASLKAARESGAEALKETRRSNNASEKGNEIAIQSLIEAQQSLEVSRLALRESLRARAFVSHISIDFDAVPPLITARIVNRGIVWAERFAQVIEWISGEFPRQEGQLVAGPNSLSPGGVFDLHREMKINPAEIPVIRSGSRTLRIWVKYEYGDVFSEMYPRQIDCFEYNSRLGGLAHCDPTDDKP